MDKLVCPCHPKKKVVSVGIGCDILGYIVRSTHLLVRRRTIVNFTEKLNKYQSIITKPWYRGTLFKAKISNEFSLFILCLKSIYPSLSTPVQAPDGEFHRQLLRMSVCLLFQTESHSGGYAYSRPVLSLTRR